MVPPSIIQLNRECSRGGIAVGPRPTPSRRRVCLVLRNGGRVARRGPDSWSHPCPCLFALAVSVVSTLALLANRANALPNAHPGIREHPETWAGAHLRQSRLLHRMVVHFGRRQAADQVRHL